MTEPPTKRRTLTLIATACLLVLSWMLMQAVHETGHVIAALVSGGRVLCVVLHPLRFSQTVVDPNPHPAFVVWSGPIFGVVAPTLLWLAWRSLKAGAEATLRFFAGFCLLANGAYAGLGWIGRVGDTALMMHFGAPAWLLAILGGATMLAGVGLWHGLGPRMGLRRLAGWCQWPRVAVLAAVTLVWVTGAWLLGDCADQAIWPAGL